MIIDNLSRFYSTHLLAYLHAISRTIANATVFSAPFFLQGSSVGMILLYGIVQGSHSYATQALVQPLSIFVNAFIERTFQRVTIQFEHDMRHSLERCAHREYRNGAIYDCVANIYPCSTGGLTKQYLTHEHRGSQTYKNIGGL